MKKIANEKLASLINPLKEDFKGLSVITIGQIEAIASKYNVHPRQVMYIVQAVFGKEICDRAKKKYGSWVHRDELLKEAYVKGMEVEIYDECEGKEYKGKIIDVSPTSVTIETEEGKKVISKGCIPEWGLTYVLEE